MSSNLTISYTSQTAAGSAPSGAPAADAPAADSPLGFLAALIDQLLAGGTDAVTKAASGDAGADATVAGLLDLNLDTDKTTDATPTAADLLASLTGQLDALQAQLANGSKPSPEQIGKLNETMEALSSLFAAPNAANANMPAGAGANLAQLRDRFAALSQSVAATSPALSQQLDALATKLGAVRPAPTILAPDSDDEQTIAQIIRALLGEAAAADDAKSGDSAAPDAQFMQLLASLGITLPTDAATPAPATNATTAVSPDLVRLSEQLGKLSAALAGSSPELAQKLDAVAAKLVSGDTDPKLFAQLTGAAANSDRTALDKLVQSLIDSKPASPAPPTAPQIAAAASLDIPAPLAPKQSKPAATEVKAAPPEPAPVTAGSAPSEPAVKIAAVAVAAKAVEADAEPKVDAKIVADTVKTTELPGAPSSQQGTVPTPLAANQARALPAAYQPVANPINMGQVAFEMVRQVHQGSSRFTIRLDPPEMGRVDVRMHVDAQGTVNARLVVDRAETLDMFQRDQRSLERALAQAGLDSSKTNLEFSLRQNPFAGMTGGDQRQQQNFGGGARFSLNQSDEQAAVPAITLYRGIASAGGVNIFA